MVSVAAVRRRPTHPLPRPRPNTVGGTVSGLTGAGLVLLRDGTTELPVPVDSDGSCGLADPAALPPAATLTRSGATITLTTGSGPVTLTAVGLTLSSLVGGFGDESGFNGRFVVFQSDNTDLLASPQGANRHGLATRPGHERACYTATATTLTASLSAVCTPDGLPVVDTDGPAGLSGGGGPISIAITGPNTLTIVNVGYRSTNFWVVSAGRSRLLVDLGWPGMFNALEANLKRADIPVAEITHGLATHYHIDHAGAAQDLKNRGMRLVVTEEQVSAIPTMARYVKPSDRYTEIALDDNLVISCEESRALLGRMAIAGRIVPTPGHSDESVTLLLDTGEAFTGDLTAPGLATEAAVEQVAASWRLLRDLGARSVYPGHGPVRPC